MRDPLRYHRGNSALHGTIDLNKRFGGLAESFARSFGTVQYLVVQSVLVAIWIALNIFAVAMRWDPYPFILLNLMFSTQAAYAAPLILLAQNREADRDKASELADALHRESLAREQLTQLAAIRELTEADTALTRQVHELVSGVTDPR